MWGWAGLGLEGRSGPSPPSLLMSLVMAPALLLPFFSDHERAMAASSGEARTLPRAQPLRPGGPVPTSRGRGQDRPSATLGAMWLEVPRRLGNLAEAPQQCGKLGCPPCPQGQK